MGALLGSPGTLKRVQVIQRGNSPRVVRARVYGSRGSRVLTGPSIRARLGLDDTWAYFTRVSTSAARVRGARAASAGYRALAGTFVPAPRSRELAIERRENGDWVDAGSTVTDAKGRYRATVVGPGTYRVRSGAVAGPPARLR
jgi:stage II sporulation protein D